MISIWIVEMIFKLKSWNICSDESTFQVYSVAHFFRIASSTLEWISNWFQIAGWSRWTDLETAWNLKAQLLLQRTTINPLVSYYPLDTNVPGWNKMESSEGIATSVQFEPLHNAEQKSRAILLFYQILDEYDTVLVKESWTNFMDGVSTMIPTLDTLLQYLEGHYQHRKRILIQNEQSSKPYRLPMRGWQYSFQYSLPTSGFRGFQGGQCLGFQGCQGKQGFGFQDFQGWQSLGFEGFQGGQCFGFQGCQGGRALGFKVVKAGRALGLKVVKAGRALNFKGLKVVKAGRALEMAYQQGRCRGRGGGVIIGSGAQVRSESVRNRQIACSRTSCSNQ